MASSTSISKTGLNDDNVIFAANESEVQRLDIQHKVVYAAMPQLVLAPIDLAKGGYRVLDQATGSGIWLRDVRQANIGGSNTWIGTDIEDSYFPQDNPADTSYHYQSMTESWPEHWLGTFDLVHSRMALPGVGLNPLEGVVTNLISLVKPGGWIQLVEMEWQDWDAGPVLQEFQRSMKHLVSTVTNGQGVDLREGLDELFKTVGLTNVQFAIIDIPVGAKAKNGVSELSLQSMYATASFAADTLRKLPPVDIQADLDSLPSRLVSELRDMGGAYKVFALWAQKPL
ncbi:hypothetical protein OPT61_g6495 [Boeremia exigua]|uniref:Uncharacterized protein n=1 Tax=Boeremia exigua TaxID=749465 RepID=A0ACC2I6E0_9PLEO|nr:hypothetical protein OPT61_g6495 [Boeremia exigua]